jgi:serine/threonine protein phosphatase PrpC
MPRKVKYQFYSAQGLRETNEDAELMMVNMTIRGDKVTATKPEYAPVNAFVICDGHGGSEISEFVAPLLLNYLMAPDNEYPLEDDHIEAIYDRIHKKIKREMNDIALECGTTALAVVHYVNETDGRDYLQIFNTGDCRAVVSRKGIAIPLTKDHKPSWPDEARRICQVNEQVENPQEIIYEYGDWRVNGLSVTRAFGDLNARPQVTHMPDSHLVRLQSKDQFLVIACDGLWDVMENHDVVNFVTHHQEKRKHFHWTKTRTDNPDAVLYPDAKLEKSQNLAQKLALYSIAKGSTDNVSVILVYFS